MKSSDAENFINYALCIRAIEFGLWKLKGDRDSPYFFNAGVFNTGRHLNYLAEHYARILSLILESHPFDVVLGPAYRGIPLALTVVEALYNEGHDIGYAYGRKEKNTYGDRGVISGYPIKGKKVLVADDVMGRGEVANHWIKNVKEAGGEVVVYIVIFDRQERCINCDNLTASDSISREHNFPVISIAGASDLVAVLQDQELPEAKQMLPRIREYLEKFGPSSKAA